MSATNAAGAIAAPEEQRKAKPQRRPETKVQECGGVVVSRDNKAGFYIARRLAEGGHELTCGPTIMDACERLLAGEGTFLPCPSPYLIRSKPARPDYCRWVVRPVKSADHPGAWTGTLEINGDQYDVTHCYATGEGPDGGDFTYEIYDLYKLSEARKHHRIVYGASEQPTCDCEWATYKPITAGYKACRHVRAMEAAVRWLEAMEAHEWAAQEAQAAIERMDDGSEF